ncbi:rhomboid family intramembrane serine protease [Pseudomarimonas arenosa]|uniref:Rhomboid family intramembrane serine protease n=1 Tax=Pseudomarimonas arenosa TaxID=2774145 RepID=A0AAW3ZHR4_9GAMM|nr:rhomboid family intramembrane serine protease [Pseudomarimonas arenosa]MBD8525079.1 rhomboid family intramembrane serine protease [Pseudomarimonas arenosa]
MVITLGIIAITVLVSWAAFSNQKLLSSLILWPPAIQRNYQFHRLISYGLIHADFNHLLFNMITLFFFGRVMEGFFVHFVGWLGYLGFYLGAIVCSVLPGYFRNRHNPHYRTLGASGAVSAVLFAFILLQPWSMLFVFFLPLPAIVYAVIYIGYSLWQDHHGKDNINHSAHLWGAAYGVVVVYLIKPDVLQHFLRQLMKPGFSLS